MFAKTILCVIGTGSADADLESAITLCGELGAHLSVLVIAIAASPAVGDYPLGTVQIDKREADATAIAVQERKARSLCEQGAVSFDVSSIYVEKAWADDEIAERARYADLVMVGASVLGDSDLKRQTVNGTLFAAERPVMIVPEGAQPTLRPRTVLLAWDSTAQASRAVYDMRHLMAAADSVHVTMVDPEAGWRRNGQEPGADIAAYLVRYGANVTVDRLPSGGRPVVEVLAQHASDIGADLVVMGAYHHSRLRERMLGGVTRTMLDEPKFPILMSR